MRADIRTPTQDPQSSPKPEGLGRNRLLPRPELLWLKVSALGWDGHTRLHVCCTYTCLWACKCVRNGMSVGVRVHMYIYTCICVCHAHVRPHMKGCVRAGMRTCLRVHTSGACLRPWVAVGRCAAGTAGGKPGTRACVPQDTCVLVQGCGAPMGQSSHTRSCLFSTPAHSPEAQACQDTRVQV